MPEDRPFVSRLIASRHSMFVVGEWLHRQFYSVEIPAFRIAPSVEEHAEYLDDGDVFAFVHSSVRHRYEVRRLKVCFTSRLNWPFGDRIFVDRKDKVDRANGGVVAYVTVSNDYRALAVIPRNSSKHWRVVEVDNTLQKRTEESYSCPLEHAYFELLPGGE